MTTVENDLEWTSEMLIGLSEMLASTDAWVFQPPEDCTKEEMCRHAIGTAMRLKKYAAQIEGGNAGDTVSSPGGPVTSGPAWDRSFGPRPLLHDWQAGLVTLGLSATALIGGLLAWSL